MTVTSTVRSVSYPGAGSAGPFPYTFRIYVPSDLIVTTTDASGMVTTLTYLAQYTVTGVGNRVGGTVMLTNALAVGLTLTIQRTLPILQLINYRNQGAMFAANIEDGFDQLIMICQQLAALIGAFQQIVTTVQTEQGVQSGQIGALQTQSGTNTTNITNIQNQLTTIVNELVTITNNITVLTGNDASLQAQINSILAQIVAGIPYIGIANPMTLQGDMIIGGPAPHLGQPTRLPVDAVGKFLVMWGTPAIPTWLYLNLAGIAAASGQSIVTPVKRVPHVYSVAGAHTHVVSAGVTSVEYEGWGAGAGGNASGGTSGGKGAAGGGGGYVWAQVTVTPGQNIALVVGAGGASAQTTSADGGDSTVDVTVAVAQGGKTPIAGAQGLPGNYSGTATNKWGATGGYGMATSSSSATDLACTLIGGQGAHGGGQGAKGFIVHDHTLGITADGDAIGSAPGGGGVWSTTIVPYDGYDGMIIVWEYQ